MHAIPAEAAAAPKLPFYRQLYFQVVFAIVVGVLLGYFEPAYGAAMKPFGDAFIKLIKMIIAPVIFLTFSTLALVVGLIVANVFQPGAGMNINVADLDQKAVQGYVAKSHDMSMTGFVMDIIPKTLVSPFIGDNILQVLLVAVLFGVSLAMTGDAGKPILDFLEALQKPIFKLVNIVMKAAPIGAFGAMARVCGFSVIKLIRYLKEELLLVLGTSSSESALPSLMHKMEHAGCKKSVVGLVVPTGYSFNLDGTNIYMTLAALFIAQATNTELTLGHQIALLLVAMLSSKGAAGVTGAGFITLAATLAVVPEVPVAGMALILGVDRFMSECRSITNFIGNAVATVVVSRWEKGVDMQRLNAVLDGQNVPPLEEAPAVAAKAA